MKHLSLFSGIGGFDLAAEWMGWENISHTEWNSFGQKILHHHWPNATTHGDITKTDYTIYNGRVDILTGGFPCQPYSVAGKRKGKDDERHLWPEMLRAIREIAPRWVVGENVGGLINWSGGMVFDEVQADLEAEGYEILPFLLPAASVNAPHRRDRIWFVAYSISLRSRRCSGTCDRKSCKESIGSSLFCKIERSGFQQPITDTSSTGRKKLHFSGKSRSQEQSNWTGDADRNNWQNFPTQSPVCDGDDGFPTESLRQFFREDSNGIISEEEIDKILHQAYGQWRNETIKAGGNAIVPQVVYQIFKAIDQYELP